MFAAWLPALSVSPGVWLALNRQLRAAGGDGASLPAWPSPAGESGAVWAGNLLKFLVGRGKGVNSLSAGMLGCCVGVRELQKLKVSRPSVTGPADVPFLGSLSCSQRDAGAVVAQWVLGHLFGNGELVVTGETLCILEVSVPAAIAVPRRGVGVRPRGGRFTPGRCHRCS